MQVTCHRASSEVRDEVCSLSCSGVVDSMFDQNENVATAVVSSSMQLLSVDLHQGVWSRK